MNFFTVARIYRYPDDEISLQDVWTIADGELSAIGEKASESLQSIEKLADLHREVAWAAQALIEFADLADFTPSEKGRLLYKNYLYFEAVSALREATVGLLNGSPRASTGLLRTVLEMLMLHCWWQMRISRKGNSEQFDDWLAGQRAKPRFRDVIANNFEWLGIPREADATDHVDQTYRRLCSYVHAPIRRESVTILNQGNVGQVGVGVLRHWLSLARDVLLISLEQLVHLYPQCLFPVDIVRKFGFNPPVGMYFDKFNFVPLQAVFGEEAIETYRVRLKDREIVESAMNFHRSRPDLTREEILETWNEEDKSESSDERTDDVIALWFRTKAELRSISLLLTYSDPLGRHWLDRGTGEHDEE